ncbi:MAG: bifunctional (p)ppGpp synthetase/guanosine-3',5'-bis(diphosphate) 3'-pyrophosphohydrolase, partial [Proteobacteria bacterium]|nr:bifunctional (p)ppGpp synthetase/guanosine-3',5'-bis(diphosphate) 3'-pyrophosphohydrolase [Pseudomonadota bacterium]
MPEAISYQEWLLRYEPSYSKKLNFELLTKACLLVNQLGGDLELGLKIAEELLPLNCDSQTIAASILFPTLHHLHPSFEQIEIYVPLAVSNLALGVEKMDAIEQIGHQRKGLKADNIRKMCLAMVDDVRIVLIKLAEQLALLKGLRKGAPDQQQKIAQQVSEIYAPLANRLGVGHIKWQMEDWSFRYLNPTEYKKISQALNMRRQDREVFITRFIEQLRSILKNGAVHSTKISGRAKHIFSIYRKIHRKGIDFTQIYDTSAVRILVKTIEDCYQALSIVHSTWQPIAAEFDDYIAKPKPNGYRSIHTVIIGPNDLNVE